MILLWNAPNDTVLYYSAMQKRKGDHKYPFLILKKWNTEFNTSWWLMDRRFLGAWATPTGTGLEAWKSGNLEAWEPGSLDAWKSGSLEVWKPGSLGRGNSIYCSGHILSLCNYNKFMKEITEVSLQNNMYCIYVRQLYICNSIVLYFEKYKFFH